MRPITIPAIAPPDKIVAARMGEDDGVALGEILLTTGILTDTLKPPDDKAVYKAPP